MTTNFFNHKQTPINSEFSPVENLAQEVQVSFEKLSKFLKDGNPTPTLSSVLGNYLLLNINTHGIEVDNIETITIPKGTSQITLDLEVKSILSVAYYDTTTSSTQYLEQKLPSQSFTNTTQFKVLGKMITFSGELPSNTVKISYTGIRKSFGNLNLKPNVLFNTDKTYLVDLQQDVNNIYYLEYDINLQQKSNDLFTNSTSIKDSTFLMLKNLDGYTSVEYKDVYLSGNRIYFNLNEPVVGNYKAVVFISNTTISDFLESFYIEYMKHNHSKDSIGKSIKHKDLVDLYQNTNLIYYKDTDIANYQHPQFLNREGYNPTLTSVYENALLGDLFLSSKITEDDQQYKTLLKDSNSILFGDPLRGSRLYFDSTKNSIVLLSGNGLDGFNIVTAADKKAIIINNDSYITEDSDQLVLKGKNNIVTIKGADSNSVLNSDNLKVNYKATITVIDTKQLNLESASFSTDSDKNIILSKKDDSTSTVFKSLIPSVFSKATADTFSSKNYILFDNDRISTSDTNYITKSNVNGFDVKTDAFRVLSSKRNSGIHLGDNVDLLAKAYTSNYLGEKATQQDSSLYIESPPSSDIYFLKNTNDTYTYGPSTYTFGKTVNNSTAINSLKEWKGANLFSNSLSASYIELKPIDSVNKNGIKIGKTKITVIGSGLECPEGMTIVESLNTVHFITPLPESSVKCGDLTYQDVNVGKLQIFGEVFAEKSISTTEDLQVGGTINTEDINVSDTTTTKDLTVSGDTKILGDSVISGIVNINNKVIVTGETNLNGSLKVFDVAINNFAKVSGTLTVDGQCMFNNNVIVSGKLTTTGGFSTTGSVDCDSINTGPIKSSNITATGGLDVDGTINLTGPSSIRGSLDISGNTEVDGTLEVVSELTAKSLYVTTNTSLDGRLIVNNNVTFNQSLSVVGIINTEAGIYTPGTITTSELKATNTSSQTLKVTSGASIDGGLDITGNATAGGNLSVAGSCDMSSTLSVAEGLVVKNVGVKDSVDINNRLTVIGSAFLECNTVQIGNKAATTTITGNLQLDTPRLTLTGSMMIYENLNITGDAIITGNTSFTGDVNGGSSTFSSSKVTGTLTAEVAEFNRRIRCNDGIKAIGSVDADSMSCLNSSIGSSIASDLFVKNSFNMGTGSNAKMDSLVVSSITQTNADNDSTFAGNLIINKNIKGKGTIILGDENVQYTNQAQGAYLANDRLLLGTGSKIAASKFTAKTGVPDSTTTGTIGFEFDNLSNTGLYGASLNTKVAQTSLNLFIEGELKGFITKETINTSYTSDYDKHIVTLDVLKTALSDLKDQLSLNPYALVEKCYPIDSIYITMSKKDPNAILGFGTWIRFAAGRTLVGKIEAGELGGDVLGAMYPPSNLDMSNLGSIGGEYEQTLTKPQLPADEVELEGSSYHSWIGNRNGIEHWNIPNKDGTDNSRFHTRPLGEGKPHNNTQPYIVTAMWRRIG